ncbi:MAG: Gfo/Idh/MocA family oxidoreductase [Verrucomicrobiales bacterium]|nr:Gfo/Idh/MocA family oxidoreductase [Verrucomicrobiales bacterium]
MPLSRRAFLLSTAAVPMLGMPPLGAAAEAIPAAVIGHTGRGDFGHGLDGIFAGREGIVLVAVADPDDAGRERARARTGALRAYADYRELLARERPKLVSVAMRHADQHRDIVEACLKAGAHVYLEKPLARSAAESDAMLALAVRLGLKLAVAHTMRMAPAVVRLREAVQGGRLGEVREIRAFGKQDSRAGGEDMMVLGTHLFDLCRLWVGDPIWVSGRVLLGGRAVVVGDRRRVKDDVGWVAGDQVFASFGFPGGVHGTFTSDAKLRESTGHWGLEIHGTRAVARLMCDLNPTALVREAGTWKTSGRTDSWETLASDASRDQATHNDAPVTDWLAAIREGREPECSARNAAWAVEMAMGVYGSALTGRTLSFPLEERKHPLE